MALQQPNFNNYVSDELLIAQVVQIHASISKLESLKPSKQVNSLFTMLVNLCPLPSSIDILALPEDVLSMRESLIKLCGKAEGLLEIEFATSLIKTTYPMQNLNLFPYYENYVKLAYLEYKILKENGVVQPKKIAFLGSGPMPLTSFVLAMNHFKTTTFHNYDIDESANYVANQMVSSDDEMQKRMKFITRDVMEVKEEFGEYDCIFLAALVGMTIEEKVKIIAHIGKYVKKGGILLVRSAKGARAFLYPVVEDEHLSGFEVLSVFHPNDDVIVGKKLPQITLKFSIQQ